mmetsp:Transcript_14515/g.22372  ORF Transcript_14515/g.22372 Transcript_14515/m.22372 type:complete len:360 (-) Transcript_14515:181-1260(-)
MKGSHEILDDVARIMNSPRWDAEVLSFVDEYCIYFSGTEENEFHHSVYHEKFKEVVECVISDILQDCSISEEQFCVAVTSSDLISKVILEQLLALDDFPTFKRLMVARNHQLEEEAVRALHLKKQCQPLDIHCNDNTSSMSDNPCDCSTTLRVNPIPIATTGKISNGKSDNAAIAPGIIDVNLDNQISHTEKVEVAFNISRECLGGDESHVCYHVSAPDRSILDNEAKLDYGTHVHSNIKVDENSLGDLNGKSAWNEAGSDDNPADCNAIDSSCSKHSKLKNENSAYANDDNLSMYCFASSFSSTTKQKESARLRHLESQRQKRSMIESSNDLETELRQRSEHLQRQRDLIVAKKERSS